MSEWQPIETAPKDGRSVQLLTDKGEDTGFWCDYSNQAPLPSDPFTGEPMKGEWSTVYGNGEPSHWKPLPGE